MTQFIVSLQYVEFNRKQQQVLNPQQIGYSEVFNYQYYSCVCVLCELGEMGRIGSDRIIYYIYIYIILCAK